VFTFLNLGLVSMSNFQKSLTFGLPSAIAATLSMAIASTGLLYSLSSHAQSSTPGTTTTPTASPTTPSPTTPSSGGSMSKPDPTAVPDGSMSKPDPTTVPGGSMSKPDPTTVPGGSMSKPDPTAAPGGSMTKPVKKSTGKTIVDVASKGTKFTILVKALKAADLVETLAGEGPYTVFAPTDAAFKKLGSAKLKSLLKPENQEQLKKILTYHVVAGKFTSKMLKSGPVPTVEGTNITVKVKGKNVTINNKTKVTQADIKASNGVIHVVDSVLTMPAN
jgi:uncharacterized surface protein with fasciclin (FAS1) repeats